MDNLGSVSKSVFGKDMILIIIDRLTKMTRFIPMYNSVISKRTANLFLREVFRHHELSSNIVSDRDPRFTAKFWEALQKALDVQLLISTTAHPQIDGSIRSCRQGNSEAVEILCVSGTGLRGITILSRIRLQRYSTIIY